ncbi:hypothetical protein [Rhizobium leguminosarum]|uniref:hypothetical protein n=1 Tax=Rhizobium leguminosarum TaxID=384 RepID=UPI001031DD4B|nr:hypothetical protein [Rhizobium leguminosarum]TAV89586.1 hypothetical protein ELI22_10370 [Rhizobium leguminosarum]TAV94196.1 hypothetical protein ELI21_10520 [Rhizobium leguminosarum]TAW35271.1 hypothetical protein ELI23_10560 [Rhizobium leguminosarum]
MTQRSNRYEIDYKADGVVARFSISATGIEQALTAARVKLAFRYRGGFEIIGVRGDNRDVSPAFVSLGSNSVEAVLSEIVTWAHGDQANFRGGDGLEENVFFYGCLGLLDNGRDLPDDFRQSFSQIWQSLLPMNWNVDVFDDDRPSVRLDEAARGIAYAFLDTWGAVNPPHDVDMTVPWDADAEVDFRDNMQAYLFLIAVRGHATSSPDPDELLMSRYERVLPRFLAANDLHEPGGIAYLHPGDVGSCLRR